MKTTAKLNLAVLGVVAIALSGCEEGFPGAGSPPSSKPSTTTVVERDVEAPDVFSENDSGLWDGRPSLGGVWVAYPDVVDPERVIIRNTENGKFVVGALFRREREAPGPRFQLSSDAADSLGMFAGQPAELSVTALRKDEAVEVAEDTDTIPVDEPSEDVPLEETAAAAIAEAEAQTEPQVEPEAAPAAAAAAVTPKPDPQPAPQSNNMVPASSLAKPFIQIGIFSVEKNAAKTARDLDKNGLTVRVLEEQGSAKPYFRVLIGPAASEQARSKDLAKVKGMGFTDAYFVKK